MTDANWSRESVALHSLVAARKALESCERDWPTGYDVGSSCPDFPHVNKVDAAHERVTRAQQEINNAMRVILDLRQP